LAVDVGGRNAEAVGEPPAEGARRFGATLSRTPEPAFPEVDRRSLGILGNLERQLEAQRIFVDDVKHGGPLSDANIARLAIHKRASHPYHFLEFPAEEVR
jgi:hypothetical protein